MTSIYLAGPEVFLPDAVEMGRRKSALCAKYGFRGLYPLDAEFSGEESEGLSKQIFASNVGLIRACDAIIANLTPFRGPSADAGTVFEVGFAFGVGKPVFAYSNRIEPYLARVRCSHGPLVEKDGQFFARDGMSVENFGLSDNLMIDEAIRAQGREIVAQEVEELRLFTDLGAFEECLRQASRHFN
jgi:nucleoside 2-deoxyribosyltransferase